MPYNMSNIFRTTHNGKKAEKLIKSHKSNIKIFLIVKRLQLRIQHIYKRLQGILEVSKNKYSYIQNNKKVTNIYKRIIKCHCKKHNLVYFL